MNHCIRTALGLALAAGLLAACVPIPLPSIPGISRPTTKPPPISDRRIDVNGYCSQTEEDGFREQATLTVADNNVSAMQWQLWVGRRGSCQFDLSTFRQTKRRPSIDPRSLQWCPNCRNTLQSRIGPHRPQRWAECIEKYRSQPPQCGFQKDKRPLKYTYHWPNRCNRSHRGQSGPWLGTCYWGSHNHCRRLNNQPDMPRRNRCPSRCLPPNCRHTYLDRPPQHKPSC